MAAIFSIALVLSYEAICDFYPHEYATVYFKSLRISKKGEKFLRLHDAFLGYIQTDICEFELHFY